MRDRRTDDESQTAFALQRLQPFARSAMALPEALQGEPDAAAHREERPRMSGQNGGEVVLAEPGQGVARNGCA